MHKVYIVIAVHIGRKAILFVYWFSSQQNLKNPLAQVRQHQDWN